MPSVAGQAEAIAEALGVAGVNAETITYVETHGTGTAVGDPLEIKGLTQAFRGDTALTGYCAIGSLKTNVGHLDTAAGVAGLIKTALALRHRQVPASLNFQNANPQIDFESTPFCVNTSLVDWKSGGNPRRAGVTALGIGGTNAHVVLEEAPATNTNRRHLPVPDHSPVGPDRRLRSKQPEPDSPRISNIILIWDSRMSRSPVRSAERHFAIGALWLRAVRQRRPRC